MTDRPRDNLDIYFADKLWRLMPAIHRTLDTDQYGANGPLREMINRIGASAAQVRRSFDRQWDDAFIETCDDWVIPYIADLLDTRLVYGLDSAGQRRDVANTISYRRRKGTLGVIEQVAYDVTGWDVKAVEFFRRLARNRHRLDPALGNVNVQPNAALAEAESLVGHKSRTPIGGFADLRNVAAGALTGSAFDECFYTADLRAGLGRRGWFGISKLGLFVWRLNAYLVDDVTPVAVSGCPGWFCFDPTGRDIQLFCQARGAAVADESSSIVWTSPRPTDVAAPITQAMLDESIAVPQVKGAGQTGASLVTTGWGDEIANLPNVGDVFTIDAVEAVDPQTGAPTGAPQQFAVTAPVVIGRDGLATLTISPPITTGAGGAVANAPAAGAQLNFLERAAKSLYGDVKSAGAAIAVASPDLVPAGSLTLRPARGRFNLAKKPQRLSVAFAYGFSSDIGAGPYDRRGQATTVVTPSPIVTIKGGADASPPGGKLVGAQLKSGTILVGDSATYAAADVSVTGALTIKSANQKRPLLRLGGGAWVIRGDSADAALTLDGLFVSGGDVILTGAFASVTITCSTFDPGEAAPPGGSPPGGLYGVSADGRALAPTRLIIEAAVATLTIDRCVLGPLRVRDYSAVIDPPNAKPTAAAPGLGNVETATVSNSILQALVAPASAPFTQADLADPVRLLQRLQTSSDSGLAGLLKIDPTLGSSASPPAASPPLASIAPKTAQAALDALNRIAKKPGVGRPAIENLFPLELGAAALGFADGTLTLSRCTVMGPTRAHRLSVSECVLTGATQADDWQDGCARFSAVPINAKLPRPYRCAWIVEDAPLFVSTRFGDPGFAQLRADADLRMQPPPANLTAQATTILAGAADGSEMGAFARDKNPIRARALILKMQEYLPAGLVPVVVDVT